MFTFMSLLYENIFTNLFHLMLMYYYLFIVLVLLPSSIHIFVNMQT